MPVQPSPQPEGQHQQRDAAVGRRVPLGVAGASGEEMTRDQRMTGEVAKKLVGAWRYVGTTIDGADKPRGNNPKGIIYYGPARRDVGADRSRRRAQEGGRGDDSRGGHWHYATDQAGRGSFWLTTSGNSVL